MCGIKSTVHNYSVFYKPRTEENRIKEAMIHAVAPSAVLPDSALKLIV